MKKTYYLTFLLFSLLLFAPCNSVAQDIDKAFQENIEGLTIYPNPVSNGQTYVHISSEKNLSKKIEFFNVLGKRIYSTNLIGKQLNIINLNKGVYILKITEDNISEIRKLVIK
ncbi:T9SS type A sorting domain-containing protein [Seonamhaeicola aphaedonensis]|uniref:Putative secreted protein (Por secretion system target) n=1 Tax=Seonamhaeicola aphaedonensis TaxID=1461338 RepID=A0A3D9H5J8_9FLAO|nr:T9SS type A sorting domain-containing protein [Seonamhaeicola aphaedonensis]RED44770.1 putative secreted protein (Por secretion system target) [Seonamhaeicola aphaedonensis]